MRPCELPIFEIVLTMLLNYVVRLGLSSQAPGESGLEDGLAKAGGALEV
jgi:hypothetical protein